MAFLERLARELFDEALEHVPQAQASSGHRWLWTPIVRAQREPGRGDRPADPYRMPAPFLGRVANPEVLVIGQNPNVAPADALHPRIGQCSLDTYTDFFGSYFKYRRDGRPVDRLVECPAQGPGTRKQRHYGHVEDLLGPALGAAALGPRAVYADAIPWATSSLNGGLLTRAVAPHARERVLRLVAHLQPRAVLLLGRAPARLVGGSDARPDRIGDVPCLQVVAPNGVRKRGLKAEQVELVTRFIAATLASPGC